MTYFGDPLVIRTYLSAIVGWGHELDSSIILKCPFMTVRDLVLPWSRDGKMSESR